jgi:two-component sensor histidine kinase
MVLKEVNHRFKNSLQIVSSIVQLQVPNAETGGAADPLRAAAARVHAIAALHERLYVHDDPSIVQLDSFIASLMQEIGRSYGCEDGIFL